MSGYQEPVARGRGLSDGMALYLHYGSVCCSKVQLVLEEKGLKPHHRLIDHRAGESHTPEYLALNPNGVVPTLLDRGRPIIESTVICEYLEDAYPSVRLRPSDPLDRATMRLWTLRPDAGLHLACAKVTFAVRRGVDFSKQMTAARPRSAMPLADVIELGLKAPDIECHLGLYDRTFDEMAKQLNRSKWLAGHAFSLADIAMIPYVMRFEHLGLAWMWSEVDSRSRVCEWLAACKTRPSFIRVFDRFSAQLAPTAEGNTELRKKVRDLLSIYYQ